MPNFKFQGVVGGGGGGGGGGVGEVWLGLGLDSGEDGEENGDNYAASLIKQTVTMDLFIHSSGLLNNPTHMLYNYALF